MPQKTSLFQVLKNPIRFKRITNTQTLDLRSIPEEERDFIVVPQHRTPMQHYEMLQEKRLNPSPEVKELRAASELLLSLYPDAKANVSQVLAKSQQEGLLKKAGTLNEEGQLISELLASVLENELIPMDVRMAFGKDYYAKTEKKVIQDRSKEYSDKMQAELELWFEQNPNPRLEKNECSRLHKLKETMADGVSVKFAGEKGELPNYDLTGPTFVVRHDWASVIPGIEDNEWQLPYDRCTFEFKVCGKVFIVLYPERVVFIEMTQNIWITIQSGEDIFQYLDKQVRAVCVSLDAQVTEYELIRQPVALNLKREKSGKIPLSDYHVVDLTRRLKAARNPNPVPSGVKVRLHWRRGHWRNFSNHRTWINWMLVGNPDLGFIDKEYKL